MKSSVTKWTKRGMDFAFYFFISIIIVQMMAEGDWWFLIVGLVGAGLLFGVLQFGIDWMYNRKKCPSKWMDTTSCNLPKNHDGNHQARIITGDRVIHWEDTA